jgi:hypothetical protein
VGIGDAAEDPGVGEEVLGEAAFGSWQRVNGLLE